MNTTTIVWAASRGHRLRIHGDGIDVEMPTDTTMLAIAHHHDVELSFTHLDAEPIELPDAPYFQHRPERLAGILVVHDNTGTTFRPVSSTDVEVTR